MPHSHGPRPAAHGLCPWPGKPDARHREGCTDERLWPGQFVNVVLTPSTLRGAALVPLSTVASLSEDLGPLTINHTGQLQSVTLSFNLSPETALSKATVA